MATAPYVINPDDPTQPTENLTMGAAAAELRGLKQRVLLAREETADLETRALTHEGANPYELDAQLNANENKITELPQATEASDAVPLSQVLALIGAAGSGIVASVRQKWIATEGQTVFLLTMFSYVPTANNIAVYVDGIRQDSGTAYLETNSTSFTFTEGLQAGSVVNAFSNESVNADAVAVLRADLASTASGKGAEMVAFKQSGTGAVDRTQQEKNEEAISLEDYGAVSGGTVDASAAFQLALNAAQGKTLRADGVYLLSAQVTISDNTRLDLSKARIIVGTTDHCIKAIGKKGITVVGGRFEPHSSIVTGVHPTGTYGASDALYFEGCEDCHVTQGTFTGFYGAVNFYNCSRCTAWENTLRDNAGGIQLLASSNFSGNQNCVGVSFHDNIATHSGDDAFSFLVGVDGGSSGSVALSSIVNNYISKDVNPTGKNTAGLARGVALIGGQTNTANTIRDCVVAHNRGYMMGTEFVRVTGAVRVKISDNTCNGFAYSPDVTTSPAFTFGDRSTGQYGVIESTISGNSATDADKLTKTFQFDGAQGCQIVDNFADSPVAGEGAIRFDNCTENDIRGNRAKNTLGFGLDLQATTSGNTVSGGSVSGSVVAIRNDGSGNLVENVRGVRKRTTGTTAIGSAATSVTVNHQVELLASTSRLKIRVTANSPLYGASEFWVSNKGSDYFDILLDAVPGGANVVYFEWEAWEARD